MANKNLYLTSVNLVPSHEGEKKIMKAAEKLKSRKKGTDRGVYRDEYGRSAEDYESLNMPIPSDFYNNPMEEYDVEPDEDGNIFLDPTELEYEFGDAIVPLDAVDLIVDNPEIGSLVHTKAGNVVHVEETSEEIYFYMTMMQMSEWEKFKTSVLSFFARIQRIFKRKQKQQEIILE